MKLKMPNMAKKFFNFNLSIVNLPKGAMDTFDIREEFDMWLKQADQTLAAFEQEAPKKKQKPQPQTSFFNDLPSEKDYSYEPESNFDSGEWQELFAKTLDMDFGDSEDLLNEDEGDGFGTFVRGIKQITKGDISYFDKPQYSFGIGTDVGGQDGKGIRVSKDFSQGEMLEKVAELGTKIEVMERKAHRADILKKEGERDKMKKELESLREELHRLSEKMQSQADVDVT